MKTYKILLMLGSNTSIFNWCCNQMYWNPIWCSYSWTFSGH